MIDDDLPCARCGYNLRTRTWDSNCPECNRPARASAPLRGFRIQSERGLRKLRAGVALLIVGTLAYALGDVIVTLGLRFFFDITAAQRRAVLWIWLENEVVVQILTFFSILLVAQRFSRSKRDQLAPRLGLLAVSLGAVALAIDLGWRITDAFIPSGPWGWGDTTAYAVKLLCESLALCMIWVHLSLRVAPDVEGVLRRVMLVSTVVPVAVLCAAVAISLDVAALVNANLPQWLHAVIPFWHDAFALWWQDSGHAIVYMGMLPPLWLYVRRLDAAARARERAASGRD